MNSYLDSMFVAVAVEINWDSSIRLDTERQVKMLPHVINQPKMRKVKLEKY